MMNAAFSVGVSSRWVWVKAVVVKSGYATGTPLASHDHKLGRTPQGVLQVRLIRMAQQALKMRLRPPHIYKTI
jgi:hypothetical protein